MRTSFCFFQGSGKTPSCRQIVKSYVLIRFYAAIFSILFGVPSSPGVLLTSSLLTAFSTSLAVTGGINKSAVCVNSPLTMFTMSSEHVVVLAFFSSQPKCYFVGISPGVFINFISELHKCISFAFIDGFLHLFASSSVGVSDLGSQIF